MGAKNTMEYMNIRHRLMDLIVTGGGTPQRIPPSRKLAEEFGCTHPTVLRALKDLAAEKLIVSCKRNGYITTPSSTDVQNDMKIFGVVIQSGKADFDTAFFEAQYHAVASEILDRSHSYCVRNIYLETPSRLRTAITENSLSGLILIMPIPEIIQEAKKEEKKGLPVVTLYRKTELFTSCDLGAEKVYEKALELLCGEKRRNLLLIGKEHYYYLSDIEKMLPRFKKKHPDVQVTFLKENMESNFQTLSEQIKQGKIFDGAVFLQLDKKIYNFLHDSFDVKEQCRLIMDQFAIFRDMNFTGWNIYFDMSGAARFLVDTLFEANAEKQKEYRDFEFDFRFYSNGIMTETVPFKQ